MPKRKKTAEIATVSKAIEDPKIQIVRREPVTVFYANHTGINTSPWDLSFRFGRITNLSREDGVTIEESLIVYMSPQHAKAFQALLNQQIESYERTHGELITQTKKDFEISEG